MRFCVFLSAVACAALLAGCAQTREGAKENLCHGKYTDYFANQPAELDASTRLELKP